MGFTPHEIWAMTPWEFSASHEGWAIYNGQKTQKPEAMSDDELRDLGIEVDT